MSDELDKLREGIRRSKALISGNKPLPIVEGVTPVEIVQTETGERNQKQEPPRSE